MITVLGHKVPDTDAITSAIVYANFLTETGEPAQAIALGEINNETRFILEQAGVKTPEIVTQLEKGSIIALVDHNEA